MGDRRAGELLCLLPRLRERDVAWTASAVAWPGLDFSDLEATIRTAEEHGALHFVVFLPSFSKYFPDEPRFDWKAHWQETVQFVRGLRAKVCLPVRIAPDSWEAARGSSDPLAVEVIGTTIGSAADGKLRAGDILTAIGTAGPVAHASSLHGQSEGLYRTALTRPAANRALEQAWQGNGELNVCVLRGDATIEVVLSAKDATVADTDDLDAPFGVHIYDGPDETHLVRAIELLRFAGARSGWVLSAQLLAGPYELLWREQRELLGAGSVDLRFVPVENRFWGGNIMVGDLLTTGDFVQAVRTERSIGAVEPDVLLVPFSPFHPTYWRDLTGASFLQIERRTGLPTFPLVTGSQP